MIYYYKHKSLDELSQTEIDLLGNEGIEKYALEHNLDSKIVKKDIKNLETEIENIAKNQFTLDSKQKIDMYNEWVNKYVTYFNKNAKHEKQAYVLIGNIGCGKSTYAKNIENSTSSIIIDPDRYKMGEETERGYFGGFTELYKKPTDRELMQELCGQATKDTLKQVAETGMNLILPKATTSQEKLEKQLDCLVKNNYDIHLILIEAPIQDCASRSYYRFLIREYCKSEPLKNGEYKHGRFVPVSVITNIGDGCFTTFVKSYKNSNIRYKSFKAFYNDNNKHNNNSEELDIETMAEIY